MFYDLPGDRYDDEQHHRSQPDNNSDSISDWDRPSRKAVTDDDDIDRVTRKVGKTKVFDATKEYRLDNNIRLLSGR